MSKRKISKQQQRRIAALQSQRRQRAQNSLRLSDTELAQAQLGPEQTGLLLARFYAHVEVENTDGTTFQCHLRQHLPDPVAGDRVIWRETGNKTGVVVAIEPRSTELVRQSKEGQLKTTAANISQMLIVLAPEPEPSLLQLDKYLIAAQLLNITPIILINKVDLPRATSLLHQINTLYQGLGYTVLATSAHQATSLATLISHLTQQTSIFVGQSGVGKSSLLQTLLPTHHIEIGELSQQIGLGTHTTTTSRLYHCPQGGDVIDSPGVRQFSLWTINQQQLVAGYKEFTPYLDQCRFRNCQHSHEQQCAVKQAVANGAIHNTRYQNYLTLLMIQLDGH